MKKIFLTLCMYVLCIFAKEHEDPESLPIGNLTLPSSQQPGPLFSFGQNVIDKKDFQIYTYVDQLKGANKKITEVNPIILYGISDSLSIFGYVPFAIENQLNKKCSSGIEDLFIQLEYAFYVKEKETYANQATIVANVLFPTGSTKKNPPTGIGTSSFFIGTTASHLAIDWYYFGSFGIEIVPSQKNSKGYNNIFLEGGIGRNITYSSKKWLLTWLIEFDYVHSASSSLTNFHFIRNGSDSLFVGPSLFFSTQKFLVQAGISFPLYQNFKKQINKNDFYAAINIGWKFN